jgi:hypothetical protein
MDNRGDRSGSVTAGRAIRKDTRNRSTIEREVRRTKTPPQHDPAPPPSNRPDAPYRPRHGPRPGPPAPIRALTHGTRPTPTTSAQADHVFRAANSFAGSEAAPGPAGRRAHPAPPYRRSRRTPAEAPGCSFEVYTLSHAVGGRGCEPKRAGEGERVRATPRSRTGTPARGPRDRGPPPPCRPRRTRPRGRAAPAGSAPAAGWRA